MLPRPLRHVLDARRRAASSDLYEVRARLARRYLRGAGLEIGGLNAPLRVPHGVQVVQVDQKTTAELRAEYPELSETPLAQVDVIDDGQTLRTFADASQDFVIANHMLEHCEDAIGTLKHHLRVLRPGGILFLAVPDKRYTFDRDRPVTTLEHHLRDHVEGPAWSRRQHYEEFFRVARHLEGDELHETVERRLATPGDHIHFNVWTQREWLALLRCVMSWEPFDIEMTVKNGIEIITVLRKARY